MKKTYLSPAGRKWLKSRHAQNASEGEIGAELLAHEGDIFAPPRARGRPLALTSRLDDEVAFFLVFLRYAMVLYKGLYKGEVPDFPDPTELLREIAREFDARVSWEGEPDTRYRRLLRRRPENLKTRHFLNFLDDMIERPIDYRLPPNHPKALELIHAFEALEKKFLDLMSPTVLKEIQERRIVRARQ